MTSVQRDWLISLMITLGILAYSVCFEIWPTHQQMTSLCLQNPALKAELATKQFILQNQAFGLSDQDFYQWANTQDFSGLKLLSVTGDPQTLKVILAGTKPVLSQFLTALAASRFSNLALTNMQSATAQLEITFASVKFQPEVAEPPKIVQTKPIEPPHRPQIVGVIHQNGIKFCVIEHQNETRLEAGGPC